MTIFTSYVYTRGMRNSNKFYHFIRLNYFIPGVYLEVVFLHGYVCINYNNKIARANTKIQKYSKT